MSCIRYRVRLPSASLDLDRGRNRTTFGCAIGRVVTPDMHHRAEVFHIPQRLGVKNLIEGDLLSREKQTDGA